ncbi:metal-sensing transcriptional repressor [Collinsella sp. D33t1_170424_A12]|uniref:metal-sensing transcriptional repressor n=1 Tax=Collinsella sp. D33t1_170424_A12 TaxID=2787135 RepID=UPI0018976E3E|nr:metal-sensing transcriptional repressor [Collinsella sp. D33t1_170424_A12]
MMADRERTLRLLKTARGQMDGIIKMVEDDRYCIDISTQLMATQSLIGRINADVLKAHIEHCVAEAVSSGSEQERSRKIKEVERIIEKLAK